MKYKEICQNPRVEAGRGCIMTQGWVRTYLTRFSFSLLKTSTFFFPLREVTCAHSNRLFREQKGSRVTIKFSSPPVFLFLSPQAVAFTSSLYFFSEIEYAYVSTFFFLMQIVHSIPTVLYFAFSLNNLL